MGERDKDSQTGLISGLVEGVLEDEREQEVSRSLSRKTSDGAISARSELRSVAVGRLQRATLRADLYHLN